MNVRELTQDERQVLFGLLSHVAVADGRIEPGELEELELLGDELGIQPLGNALADARKLFPTRDALLAAVATVTRRDARELIRTLLIDLATADGERTEEEEQLLTEISAVWDRG